MTGMLLIGLAKGKVTYEHEITTNGNSFISVSPATNNSLPPVTLFRTDEALKCFTREGLQGTCTKFK
ncbi:unnamed protein product, partial [Allacma fusca]